jgi:1-deoxy-D-xylulose-5-phosphate reductoisomerase
LGETAPAWLNAANEVAVAAFLAGEIGWISIADVLSRALDRHDGGRADSAEAVVAADHRAREVTRRLIEQR